MNDIPDILLFMRRSWFYHELQMSAIAKYTKQSYRIICEFTDYDVTAHQAANMCLRRSDARFVALMDDDCVPLHDYWLRTLTDILKTHDDLAAVTPLEVKTTELALQCIDNPRHIQFNDGIRTVEVPWAATYCTVLDREKIPGVWIDEDMPGRVGMTDIDLHWQIIAQGFKCAITDKTIMLHIDKSEDVSWRQANDIVTIQEQCLLQEERIEYMKKKWGMEWFDKYWPHKEFSTLEQDPNGVHHDEEPL